MDKKQKDKALKIAVQAAKMGGAIALKYFRRLKKVSIKEGAGLVSEADHESEIAIKKCVLSQFSDHKFLGEETGYTSTKRSASNALWVVDPLDGTTNYVHGFPFFCVSIGLEYEGTIQVAVVHAPLLKYTYTASLGNGAFLNGKKISVSSTDRIEDSLLATGFSYKKDQVFESELVDFKVFSQQARGVRRAGSAALDMCMVASGVFDGFWERQLAPWDTAAGCLIISEAGGKVTNFAGDPFHFSMDSIAAGNASIHKTILQFVQRKRDR